MKISQEFLDAHKIVGKVEDFYEWSIYKSKISTRKTKGEVT